MTTVIPAAFAIGTAVVWISSPLTRDSHGNLGHVTLSDIDDENDTGNNESEFTTWAAEVATQVVTQLTVLAAERMFVAAEPRVSQWWIETARPALTSTKHHTTRKLSNVRRIRLGQRNSPNTAPAKPHYRSEVTASDEVHPPKLSSALQPRSSLELSATVNFNCY